MAVSFKSDVVSRALIYRVQVFRRPAYGIAGRDATAP